MLMKEAPHPAVDTITAPNTREGYFALHQLFSVDWMQVVALDAQERAKVIEEATAFFALQMKDELSSIFSAVGGKGDLMVVHFRETLDEVNRVEMQQARLGINRFITQTYSYVSVAEASGYDSARKRQEAMLRKQGFGPGSAEWDEAMVVVEKNEAEFLEKRLHPTVPKDRYVCFYPMNKRRGEHKNWFRLTNRERGMMMRAHAVVGRRYTDRVTQIITGSIGFDDYEWGVTLFSEDPVVFKNLVYEMRFDEASADYAEFGPFVSGIQLTPEQLGAFFDGQLPD